MFPVRKAWLGVHTMRVPGMAGHWERTARAETCSSAKCQQAAWELARIATQRLVAWVMARAMAASSAVIVEGVWRAAIVGQVLSKLATVVTSEASVRSGRCHDF